MLSTSITTPPLIPSYSICYPCRGSMCFAHPLNLVGYWSIQHSSMACIFAFPFLVFVIFHHGVVKKAIKRHAPIYVGTWQGTRKHYKRRKQLEHITSINQPNCNQSLISTILVILTTTMQLLEISSYWLDQFYIYFHPLISWYVPLIVIVAS